MKLIVLSFLLTTGLFFSALSHTAAASSESSYVVATVQIRQPDEPASSNSPLSSSSFTEGVEHGLLGLAVLSFITTRISEPIVHQSSPAETSFFGVY